MTGAAIHYEVLQFLRRYWEEHGYAPSYREIKEGTSSYSISQVARVILELEMDGHVSKVGEGRRRAVRAID